MRQTAPFGSWKSRLSAERAVAAGIGLGDVSFDGNSVLWQESRPAEKGRNVVMRRTADGTPQELNPAPWNARTRVHEYGGRAYLMDRGSLFFSHFAARRAPVAYVARLCERTVTSTRSPLTAFHPLPCRSGYVASIPN